MRICLITDFFVPHYHGGGERRFYEILKRLVKRHEITVVCMRVKGVADNELIDGILVHHIGPTIEKPPERGTLDFIRFLVASFFWILWHDYDIVDSQGIARIAVAFACRFRKAKSIATVYDLSSGKSDQWIGEAKKYSRFADKVERFSM
ncbi:glycosyltransferase, partial [Candidatus Woesearchaeota archaeon]|nr:glycosyltransferase [Candidatus Woesearchaeota archaeon]